MLGIEDHTNFFFRQKKQKRPRRRVRKFDDTQSIHGREGITFLIGEREGETTSLLGGVGGVAPSLKSGTGLPHFKTLAGTLPKLSPSRKNSILEPPPAATTGTSLPPIDPSGPRLVTEAIQEEAVETRSIYSEKKFSFLKEIEAKTATKGVRYFTPGTTWSLNEAKFASTGILLNLNKTLTSLAEKVTEVTLPTELVSSLSQTQEELVADTVVERREWQTDCYLDFKSRNINPFLTDVPEKDIQEQTRAAVESTLKHKRDKQSPPKPSKVETSKVAKKVRMSQETKAEKKEGQIPERPHTARSVMSNFSLKSDLSDDGRESAVTTDYDRLPAELRPSILHYRRESVAPKMKRHTRMEKMNEQKEKLEREKSLRKVIRKEMTVSKVLKRVTSAQPKRGTGIKRPGTARLQRTLSEETGNEEGGIPAYVPKTTINFSVEESTTDKQEWLVHPTDAQDPEAHTLRMWDRKLKELHRKREESRYMDMQRGANKQMVVKFYNEPQIRALRSKHQRSSTVPLPALFSKLPPSMGSFSTPSFNEAALLGEGMKVFVLTLPDGSGYCNYMSGRQAISQNRCDNPGPLRGSRGLYTLVFDDTERSHLLAYFTPMGKACCYYQSGAIRMLSDSKGGSLYSEEGVVTKKWEWPPPKMTLPVTVSLYLNVHISLRCTNLANMDLRMSARGRNYKFPVGPSMEDLNHIQSEDLGAGDIQSTCSFISKAAKSHSKYVSDGEDTLEKRRGTLTRRKATKLKILEEDANSNLQADGEKFSLQLDCFKKNVHNIVSEWMQHYCKTIGITVPSAASQPSSREEQRSRGVASRTRMVKSSMDYVTGMSRPSSSTYQLRRTRSLTHPLSSRPSSRAMTPVPFKLHLTGDVEEERAASTSPFPLLRPATPLDIMQPPPTSELHSKPFKVGKAKASTKSGSKSAVGCPVALHNMLWKKLNSMPPCKCDKRRVPFISDLEYDVFLLSHVPRHQLVIICIIKSLKEGSCPCEPMIDATYTHQNRLRFSPCQQSSHDSFRLIKYDLDQARVNLKELGTVGNRPLLVERHNASPGMFLMYMSGKLVYADHVFNGYSTTKKDFMKQVENCIQRGKRGQFLPYDFKFTRRTGTKIHSSSAWAYPVSGFMQDLVPFSPQSGSHSTSRTTTPVPRSVKQVPVAGTDSEELESERADSMSVSQFTLQSQASLNASQFKMSQTLILEA